ncbi:MAG: hypothetical protein HZA08_09195 [Nitrospirae bacterium]|nr:hypothetical protein [Nitrospirota bacterium]
MRLFNLRRALFMFFLSLSFSIFCTAMAASVPQSQEESITYWKPFEITADEDLSVKDAHGIFDRLLTGWEETRIPPKLYVVHSDSGPWAASLDDGSVLLSREAIDVCFRAELHGGHDRLAFVLGHELAHQRADHLWHRRFFRLAGQQPPQVRGLMLSNLPYDQMETADIEAKETQADREGLLLMTITGFDPNQVAGADSRFFMEWVESLWGQPCKKKTGSASCTKAQSRSSRVQAYLKELANQTVLFELGIQAYISGRFSDARSYFTVFGRQFPSREVHNNIGMTYIGEAMTMRKELVSKGGKLSHSFMFPFMLDEETVIKKVMTQRGGTRGGVLSTEVLKLQNEIEQKLRQAISSYEKAIRIDPSHKESYWNLASAHLLLDNAPAAYGIIAGNYVKRFGSDAMSSMLLGISAYLDGQDEKARQLLEQAIEEGGEGYDTITRANLAIYLNATGDLEASNAQWKILADAGRKSGDEELFRFALLQMGKPVAAAIQAGQTEKAVPETINGYSLSQRVATTPKDAQSGNNEIWIEGQRIQVYQFTGKSQMAIDSNRTVIALWQGEADAVTTKGVHIGDDVSKLNRAYGAYGRKVTAGNSEYQVYEKTGLAFRVKQGKVAGWFLIH